MTPPDTRYYQAIDSVLCLVEDVPYRSEFINDCLEVLWHPEERRLVGLKIRHAKKVHRGLSGWPKDRPLSLLVMTCAAILDSRDHKIVSPVTADAIKVFLQQHKDTTDISPAERDRIDFTLEAYMPKP